MVVQVPVEPTPEKELYLLYRFEAGHPEKAVAIATLDGQRRVVHGNEVASTEGAFEVQ